MSYQTGTATSPINLLQTLVTWLVSIGWTQDASASDGSGWRAHLHKSGNFINLRASMNENVWVAGITGYGLHAYLGTAYVGGASAWNAQTGAPIGGGASNVVGVGMGLPAGSIQNYYFFADSTGNNVVVVVEKTAGIFVHLGWGLSLVKAGTWTGGPYFFGSHCGFYANGGSGPGSASQTSSCPGADCDGNQGSNCFVRCDVDTFTGLWLAIGQDANNFHGWTGKFLASSVMPEQSYSARGIAPRYSDSTQNAQTWQHAQTSAVDGRANLLPIHLWAVRDTGAMSLIGWIPNIFLSNGVGIGFSNASEYLLGPTTYKMFPNFAVVKS